MPAYTSIHLIDIFARIKKMKKFNCELICDDGTFCTYKTDRKDNFKNHVEETHEKKRKICACGLKFTRSSLSRHKKTKCILRNRSAPVENQQNSAQNSPIIPESGVVEVKEFDIRTTVKLVTFNDGTTTLYQNKIQFGDLLFTVMAEPATDG